MRRLPVWPVALAAAMTLAGSPAPSDAASAQQSVKGPDGRMKADILVVVAHPDDEGGVTPYLARAIYDLRKRVAVVFLTRGGSGGNDYSREHGLALADIREQEARSACAKLGIGNVWFLEGQDTASQNVLSSLANWGHGRNLEALVRIVRLTRPDVIITWLPGIFIGENHGDHQAAGVLATEAFDLAGDPAAFPAQVAGATKRLELYLENLTPWRAKKLYYFSDADEQKPFSGTGPAYAIRETSPSQKKPYWRLAMEAAMPHLTQFPEVEKLEKMSEAELEAFFADPKNMFWPDPMTLTLGESRVKGLPGGDVFEGIAPEGEPGAAGACEERARRFEAPPETALSLGGPWAFYREFKKRWCVRVPEPKVPEIAVKAGTTLVVPLLVEHGHGRALALKVEPAVPEGWSVARGAGTLSLPEANRTDLAVEVLTPELTKEQLSKLGPQEVTERASVDGKPAGEIRLKVLLKSSALPQN